jgi:threonine/homoserine/homoserine lactone efflux protein
VKELLLGVGMGLAAGLSPGPLFALVVTNTLRRGFGAGLRVAAAPVITDAPIILLTVFAVDALPVTAVRVLAAAGGIYLLWLAVDTVRQARAPTLASTARTTVGDLRQGVITNALSPHPWLFWLGVGAPVLSRSWEQSPARGIAFLAGFYALLVATKVGLAATVALTRRSLNEGWYRMALRGAGGLLLAAGGLLLWEAAQPRSW